MTNVHHHINYVEFTVAELPPIMEFYGKAFGWSFQEWGDAYISFSGAGLEGGFEKVADKPRGEGALVILYSADLEASEQKVKEAGGEIVVPPYHFPGGRRFHFRDPAGNVLAIWSEKEADGSAIGLGEDG